MTNIPETLRQASEALQQASAALVATAQAMEDAPKPEPAPELEPGEWRNDRAPSKEDEGDDGLIWVWRSDSMAVAPSSIWRSPHFWFNVDSRGAYWAPGNRPAPKSPTPDVVGSQKVEPEKPRGFFPFTPEEFATACSEPQPEAPPKPDESRTGGWIVDRVPTREDADADGQVMIPGARQDELSLTTWTSFYFVHPGMPWCSHDCLPAPWDPTCLDRNGWIRSRLPTVEDANGVGVVLIPVGRGGTTSTIAYHLIVPGQPWAPWGSNPGRFEK